MRGMAIASPAAFFIRQQPENSNCLIRAAAEIRLSNGLVGEVTLAEVRRSDYRLRFTASCEIVTSYGRNASSTFWQRPSSWAAPSLALVCASFSRRLVCVAWVWAWMAAPRELPGARLW
ncbi:MAG: hypothetical protein DMG31_01340 [Acidobacteria bacterium]|nr:MAG: hypothetical protein DMG31_01340 [Acidobacteriota bacterium]